MTLNPKFKMDDDDIEVETLRDVRYSDLCDLVKLVQYFVLTYVNVMSVSFYK